MPDFWMQSEQVSGEVPRILAVAPTYSSNLSSNENTARSGAVATFGPLDEPVLVRIGGRHILDLHLAPRAILSSLNLEGWGMGKPENRLNIQKHTCRSHASTFLR